jgi:hypothetical protein
MPAVESADNLRAHGHIEHSCREHIIVIQVIPHHTLTTKVGDTAWHLQDERIRPVSKVIGDVKEPAKIRSESPGIIADEYLHAGRAIPADIPKVNMVISFSYHNSLIIRQ